MGARLREGDDFRQVGYIFAACYVLLSVVVFLVGYFEDVPLKAHLAFHVCVAIMVAGLFVSRWSIHRMERKDE